MGLLGIKDLRENMVLAEDLREQRGRLLMSKGTVLSEKYLNICKMWGIVEAYVEGVTTKDIYARTPEDIDPVMIEAASERVKERFCLTDMDHPAVQELVRLSILRIAGGRKYDEDNSREVLWSGEDREKMEKKKHLKCQPARFFGGKAAFSTLPEIYRKIMEAISKPSSSVYDIENVINKDTNLAARLLRIVNSAFYSYPRKIDTISRAVSIVGTRQLSVLAMGVNIVSMFKGIPPETINMKMFWRHSVLCGICARILAGYKNIQNTERIFVAGLLHDVGRLVLYNNMPKEALYAVTTARRNSQFLHVAERDFFGLDHAALGGQLLMTWKLPMSLENAVEYHHEPEKSKNQVESFIIHLADIMANAMGIGSSGERFVPSLHNETWMLLGLTPNIFSLTLEQADRQLEDVFEMIYVDD
jgi:HD-like signal output (HDOD) protein